MKTQKLSPKDCKNIYQRSKAGETQAVIAAAYGVSQQLVSRVVKREREKQKAAQVIVSHKTVRGSSFAASWSTEQLINRYRVVRQEIQTIEEDKQARAEKVVSLEKERRALSREYTESDTVSQKQIHRRLRDNQRQTAYWKRQRHVDIQLQDFLEEAAELVAELIARGVTVPAKKRVRFWI